MTRADPVVFGDVPIDCHEIVDVAIGARPAALSNAPEFRAAIDRSREAFERLVASERRIYGVTTGFGESVRFDVRPEDANTLAQNLIAFHGCGTGRLFGPTESMAIVAARLRSLCTNFSAVRWEVLERLALLLERRICPAIPVEGSVGASGDLTPLSYVAAVVSGEREVLFEGGVRSTASVYAEAGIAPLALKPKESLAIMNGTSVMTALAALAIVRAEKLSSLATAAVATACDACDGNAAHFDGRIFAAKPHRGQAAVAAKMRAWLGYEAATHQDPERLQNPYSIRCAPHVVGVLEDVLDPVRLWVTTELNGCSDNPLFDPDTQTVLHGGNFYGGHVGIAMDLLKTAVASVADLLDRLLQVMCNLEGGDGVLPRNLVAQDANRETRHGFKAMSIATSALTAEALKLTMPATSFSRSTESHNQDKVSMGTIGARDALRVLELAESVAAILLIAAAQAVDLRAPESTTTASRTLRDLVRRDVAFADGDRRFDVDIAAIKARMEAGLAGELFEGVLP